MKSVLSLVLLGIGLTLSGARTVAAQALPSNDIDGIVAVVEDDVILRSELNRATDNVVQQFRNRSTQLPPRDVLEKQVLERLIMLRLQIVRATAGGIRIGDAELDQQVLRLAQQNRATLDQMRMALERDGISYEEFRQTMRDEMMVQQLRRSYSQSHGHVTDTEVDLFLANEGNKHGEIHIGHILVGVPDGASPEQIKAAKDKAAKVMKEISDGGDFAGLAVRYSDAPEALEGGDLGWRKVNEVPAAFADAINGLKVGGVTQPLRGPTGFHILKLIDQRAESTRMAHETHVRHILVRTTELVSNDEAHAAAVALRERIAKGEDFAKLAKQSSEDVQSANLGGDLGWFEANAYGTDFQKAVDGMKDGELSQPVATNAGWHIIERLGTRDTDRTAETQRDEARQTLTARKADEAFDAFLRQIRNEGFVDNRLTGEVSGYAKK